MGGWSLHGMRGSAARSTRPLDPAADPNLTSAPSPAGVDTEIA
jgi:hypothetical protein